MKILIIDDDPVVRHILSAILNGYSAQFLPVGAAAVELSIATNGREGVDALVAALAAKNIPSVVFLDLQLIDMTGVEVLEACESALTSAMPPVIVMSAQPVQEIKKQYSSRDFSLFMQKPFTPDQVIEAVKTAVSR